MNKIDEYKKNLATAEDAVDFCTLVPRYLGIIRLVCL